MIKISECHKNGKPITHSYTFPGDFQKKIDKRIAACKIKASKYIPRLMTAIGKLTKKSDKDEMCKLAIATKRIKIKGLETYKTNVLDMFPPPISEPDRQVSNFLISHYKSEIAQLKKAVELR